MDYGSELEVLNWSLDPSSANIDKYIVQSKKGEEKAIFTEGLKEISQGSHKKP